MVKIYLKLKIILNNKNIIKEELSNKEFLYQRGVGQEKWDFEASHYVMSLLYF